MSGLGNFLGGSGSRGFDSAIGVLTGLGQAYDPVPLVAALGKGGS